VSRFERFRFPGLALAVACMLASGAATADPSNKWRIQISSDADSAGGIVFDLVPVGGAPASVTVQVPADTDENDVADLIRSAMRAQLGTSYNVEVDDGEDVLVKKADGAADFDLQVRENTVDGVRINLDTE
jgi:hypothetical protein